LTLTAAICRKWVERQILTVFAVPDYAVRSMIFPLSKQTLVQ
jgi:hypothetical protein